MKSTWTRHLAKLRSQLFGAKQGRIRRKRRTNRKLNLERLEDRTLFAVSASLDATTGILSIGFDAANDQATIAVDNSNIVVSSSTLPGSPQSFAATSVKGITATGNNAGGQTIDFNNAVDLSGKLIVSGLASATFNTNAAYTASSASVAAQTIQFDAGAGLSTGTGALTLKATNDTTSVPYDLETGTNASQSGISLNGASLKGGTVNVTVTSSSAETFSDTTAADTGYNGIGASLGSQVLGAVLPFSGGVAISKADGEITIGSGSTINASSLKLNASASSSATVNATSTALGVAYSESDPTAQVVIDNGVTIDTTGDMSVDSSADSNLEAEASKGLLSSFSSTGGPVDVTLAVGESTINSTAQISSGATITVGGNLSVNAEMTKSLFTESSAGAYQDGALGVGLGFSQSTSNVNATVGGTVSAGSISITADSTAKANTTIAMAVVGKPTLHVILGAASGINSTLTNWFNKIQPTPSCSSNANAMGSLGTTIAYAQHTNNATAAIDNSAQVTSAKGGTRIDSTITDAPLLISWSDAEASANSKPPVSLSAAVSIGSFTNNSNANVGQNAVVNANGDLQIDSKTSAPLNFSWTDNIADPSDLVNYLSNNFSTLFKSGLGGAGSIAWSTAVDQNVGVGGSVDFFTINDTSNANIDSGAQINQDQQHRSADQTVEVEASNDVETVNASGLPFDAIPTLLGKTGKGAALGGAYLGVTYNDTVAAQIQGDAVVYASALAVTANATTRAISVAGSGALSPTFSLNGTFSQLTVNNQTLAQISSGALVVTGTALVPNTNSNVLVQAKDDGTMIDASGVLATSQAAAIGFSVALNNITRKTEALIGDQGTTNSTPTGSVTAGGAVSVTAANTGLIASGSLAGAVTTSPPPAPPPGSPPPPPPPPCIQATQGEANEPSAEGAGVVGEVISAEGDAASEESTAGSESSTKGGTGGSGSNGSQGSGSFGIGISADVSINTVNDTTTAYIHNAKIIHAAGVSLNATNGSKMYAIAGAVTITAGSKEDTDVGLAGSLTDNLITDATSAYVDNSNVTSFGGALSLTASNTAYILAIDASGTGSRSDSGVSVAGSVALNKIANSTEAYLNASTIDADSLSQEATDTSSMLVVAGAIDGTIGGTAGVGLSFAWNQINNTTAAYDTGTTITAPVPISLMAQTEATIKAISASLALSNASKLAAAGAVSINSTSNNTNAYFSSSSLFATTSSVSASDTSTIHSIAGDLAATGGTAGIGGSFSSNSTANKVAAYADNAKVVASGAISFKASETADIETLAAGGSGADGFSLAGAVTLNQIDNTVSAYLADGAKVTSNGNAAVMASDGSTIKSLAGAVSGAGKATVGASFAVNEIGDSVLAYVNNSTLTTTAAGGTLDVDAGATGLIETISAAADGAGTFALGGAVSLNKIDSTISAYAANHATVQTNDGNLGLTATDGSKIEALAGAVTGAGNTSINASVAVNNIGNTVSAYVADSTATILAGNSAAVLTINSVSNGTIETIAAGGSAAAGFSLGGSVAVNQIQSTVTSYVTSATVLNNSTNNASDIDLSAEDNSTIESIAGTINGAGSAVGASVTVNNLGNTITAYVDQSSTVTALGGNVNLRAASAANIESLTGTGEGAGTFALGGAVSFNHIHNTIQSEIQGGSNVTGEAIGLSSEDTSEIESLAADASISGAVAIGAAIAIDLIRNTIAAYVADAKAQSKQSNVSLSALSNATIKSLSAGVSGSGTVSITGAVSYNKIGNTVEAYASNVAQITSADSISITAQDTSNIQSLSGQISIGVAGEGIGGAAAYNQIGNNIWAFANTSSTLTTHGGNVALSAASTANIQTVAAGGAFGGIDGVAGSVAITDMGNDVKSYLDGATVTATGDLSVTAKDAASPSPLAGTVALGGVTGVGGAVEVSTLTNSTLAYVTDSTANAGGTMAITADSTEDVAPFAASLSGSVGIGAGGSVTINTIAVTTQAYIAETDTGLTQINQDPTYSSGNQNLQIEASDTPTIDSQDGDVAAGALVGAGAALDVQSVGNTVTAYIGSGVAASAGGSLQVLATSLKNFSSTVLGASAGALGLQGTASVLDVGSDITSNGTTAVNGVGSTVNSAIPDSLQLSVSSVFDPNTTIAQATTATIGNNAVITGGSIQVSAKDTTTVQVEAGAAVVGLVTGGAGVGVVTLGDSTNAFVGQGANLTATSGDIDVTSNAEITNASVQADAGAVGVAELGAAVAELNSTNNARAYIDSNATVNRANTVNVTANTASNLSTNASGAIAGVAGIGAVVSNVSENGTTQAYLGNDVKVGETSGQSVGNLFLQATSTPTLSADSSASAGGVASGNGSFATADATPTVNADLGDADGGGDQINVTGSIGLLAQAFGQSTSDAEGETFGGVSVGTSQANSQWSPTVGAVVESTADDPANLTAGQDFNVQAYNNYDTDGASVNANSTQAEANSSEGSLLAGQAGSKTETADTASVMAALHDNAIVGAENDVNIAADSANNLSSTASGNAYGAVEGGSVDADASLSNLALAMLGSSVKLTAGKNATILSNSNNTMAVNSTGGEGGLIAEGGAESSANLNSNGTESSIGENSTVDAGGTLNVLADNWLSVNSTTNQTAAGAFTDNETDSTANVNASLTLAAVGSNVTIEAQQFVLTAEDLHLNVTGYSNASAPFSLIGDNTANSNVTLNSQTLATIDGGTQITATSSVAINALVDFAETSSTALTSTTGVTGSLFSNADNNKNAIANVDTETGSSITTTTLNVTATVPHDDPKGYVQDAQTNAQTVVQTITEVIGTVCEVVGDVVCAWGLICNPDEVCQNITQTIQVVLDGSTDTTTPGSQELSNTIDFNSNVTIDGGTTPTLKVDSSGTVTALSGISVADGNGSKLSVGSFVITPSIDVTGITSQPAGGISLSAAEGSTSGSSQVNFNTPVVALISNDSDKDLILSNLSLYGGENSPAVTQTTSDDQNDWTYSISTNISTSSLTVDNNNIATTGNDILLSGTIDNSAGATTIHNSGGSIFANSSADYINTRLIDLAAGQLGTSSQSIFLRLPVSTDSSGTLPTGFQEAVGYRGVYLDVTPTTEKNNSPLSFLVNNINSGGGDVVLHIEDGLQLQQEVGARITLKNGTQEQGVLLDDTFNPASAVNASTGVIDLGFDHHFMDGEVVTYDDGGETSIGGLRDGGLYHVQNVSGDPAAVVLGDTFVAANVNNATGYIDFGNGNYHDFETGDQVVYDSQGGSSIAGLTNGHVYYVRYVDPTTIALTPTLADATAQPIDFAAAGVSDNTITLSSAVNWATGKAVTYQDNGSPIPGLIDGHIYYVIAKTSTTIQLAATAADASAGTALSLDVSGVTSIQDLLPGIIPLNASGMTGTQLLRVDLNPSVATGTQHSLNSGHVYLQDSTTDTITPVNLTDVQSIQEGTVTTPAPEATTVTLQNISADIGNITIEGGSNSSVTTNLLLSGTIASEAGTASITTLSGNIQNGSTSQVIQAQNIDLNAHGGAVGANIAAIQIQLTGSGGQLSASALGDIYVTAISGDLRLGTVSSISGIVVLTPNPSSPPPISSPPSSAAPALLSSNSAATLSPTQMVVEVALDTAALPLEDDAVALMELNDFSEVLVGQSLPPPSQLLSTILSDLDASEVTGLIGVDLGIDIDDSLNGPTTSPLFSGPQPTPANSSTATLSPTQMVIEVALDTAALLLQNDALGLLQLSILSEVLLGQSLPPLSELLAAILSDLHELGLLV